jgi:uncharacterized protein (DUF2249 family)
MVIRREDRVSTVLARDESLIDVFVSLSPAFERLRKPALRKVMSRLVTVEQAARIAGVDAGALVARLNGTERDGADPRSETDGSKTDGEPDELPAALAAIGEDLIVEVDVRAELRAGREPFSRIMAARRTVPDGGVLCVRAIFEPVPLYAVMTKQGFAHHTERLEDEDWKVWFYRGDPVRSAESLKPVEAEVVPSSEGVIVLDVRDLEPPEPMVRTLAALETLPAGGTLVQINVRVPQFLLPQLEERGFRYEIREQRPDLVRVVIFRAIDAENSTTDTIRGTDVE